MCNYPSVLSNSEWFIGQRQIVNENVKQAE
ncbi:hypothetical protein F383_37786 [Gossypium arboreum]|uniref:Uncharacterized protein n=1 Tax=Gossypium arboreum TaxID=29729 RepID=A0A0B0MH53_GOSAR|nr:hypothetical protein F383_37786 [Gossypium arboreum]